MILGYRDKRTRDFATGKRVKAFAGFERSAHLSLRILDLARNLRTLASIPGNHFEALKGDRKGQYSIRINRQWRVCFEWPDEALDVRGGNCEPILIEELTTQAQRWRPRDTPIATATARRRSLQRLVRQAHCE